MADNVVANPGVGGATFATDDIGGVQFPRTKVVIGVDGVNSGDVSASNPLPVTGALTDSQLRATAVPVSGPVTDGQLRASPIPVSAASLPLPTGAATESSLSSAVTKLAAGLPSALASDRLKVDGSGVTQPVSGPLTDGQLRASAVPVSGPLTDTQLRNSAVPVSLSSVPSHAVTNAGTFAVQETGAGYTPFRSIDLDETEEQVKGSPGRVHGYYLFNTHATDIRYVKFYNDTAANVTVGSTTPALTIPLPPKGGANVMDPKGIAFTTAITVAATTGVADADTGAPGANEVIANVYYE